MWNCELQKEWIESRKGTTVMLLCLIVFALGFCLMLLGRQTQDMMLRDSGVKIMVFSFIGFTFSPSIYAYYYRLKKEGCETS